ncbi:hypothetical protein CPB86DRAFT_220253 [Serendipita vermifera]|nr:hypothetical protein CPB86DRAFT_220253 [Serendipita vermifera]
MAHFLHYTGWTASRLPDGVPENMKVIEELVGGRNLFRMFREIISELCKKNKKSSLFSGFVKDETVEELIDIVAKTRQDLEALGLPDEEILAHDRYDQAATNLKESIKKLNALKTSPRLIDDLEKEMNEAIKKDRTTIDKNSKPAANRVSMALKQIDLYRLKRPHEILRTIVSLPDKTISMNSYD